MLCHILETIQSDGLVYFDKEWDPIIVGIGIAVLVIGIPLNLIVLVVSWHNRQRYPKQNVFACTLVFADLLMFCIGMGNDSLLLMRTVRNLTFALFELTNRKSNSYIRLHKLL